MEHQTSQESAINKDLGSKPINFGEMADVVFSSARGESKKRKHFQAFATPQLPKSADPEWTGNWLQSAAS
jgi:hypothetical protein